MVVFFKYFFLDLELLLCIRNFTCVLGSEIVRLERRVFLKLNKSLLC